MVDPQEGTGVGEELGVGVTVGVGEELAPGITVISYGGFTLFIAG
jgi:hypothetical protein